jgi:hypothetical protein
MMSQSISSQTEMKRLRVARNKIATGGNRNKLGMRTAKMSVGKRNHRSKISQK